MKIKKGSLSEFILLALEKTIDGYVRYDDLIHHSGHYAYGSGWNKPLKKSELAQAIKRLRNRGLIDYEDDKTNKIIFKLTNLGKDALGDLAILEEQEWDGKFRIVMFDIPEPKYLVRNLFRRRLKDWGFKMWQQSVWITKNNVTAKLRQLIDKLGIKDWVVVIDSDDPAIKTLLKWPFH